MSKPVPPRHHSGWERGSVLLLMPAAVLVVVILGAIAVDRAIIFEAQRDLVSTAQAAANDAASGLDLDRLHRDGEVDADTVLIGERIRATTAAAPPGTTLEWEVVGTTVRVRARREVRLLFAPAVPGAHATVEVTAVAIAEMRRR